jgi:hypothetical protein
MHEIGVSKPPRSLQIGVSKPPRSLQIWGKQTSAFFQGLSGNNKFLNNVAFNGRTFCLLPGDVWLAVVPWWPSLLSHLIYAAISLRISHGADFAAARAMVNINDGSIGLANLSGNVLFNGCRESHDHGNFK